MKRTFLTILAICSIFVLSGCSTSARFIIPDNTELIVHGKKAVRDKEGIVVTRRPFFWSSMKGIDYQLVRKNSIVRKGKMPSSFRVASIFWPPYAFLYWPAGFSFSCYDLTKAVPMDCEGPAPAEDDASSTGSPWLHQ